ncbi:formyltransferase family protein [Chryseobacterium sp. Leaf394]|uniref:formyltransferase family protein n=1 Tax=Chryseobacterium sp. Leaf394 TaxID=1736361 RepID=UPI0006F3141D|nr:formyltransferase family protein [Chryseobacterium sp. Leaf394]KQS91785.1 hypothetical protein ASG21_04820 [Chryseobacterium sp. Leaf394]
MTKVAVLCNNRMAVPALQTLLAENKLCAVGVPADNIEITELFSVLTTQYSIPLLILKKESFSEQLHALTAQSDAEFIFAMTFPWKIPSDILKLYPDKFYNFHYGLLPEMRGVDPVFESIKNGLQETGITVHAIEEQIDAGAIILKKIFPLDSSMTHGMLCTHLAWLASNIVEELLNKLRVNKKGTLQDITKARYFKRPEAADVSISWHNKDATEIEALVRACNPWNKGAYTQWNGWNIRVVEATVVVLEKKITQASGSVVTLDEHNGLIIKCNNETFLRLNIIYVDEGFMSGHKLLSFGIKKGSSF